MRCTKTRVQILQRRNKINSTQGSCATSRAHTYRNPGRNYSDNLDTDISSAPTNLLNILHKNILLPPLPVLALQEVRLPVPLLHYCRVLLYHSLQLLQQQKFLRTEAQGTDDDTTAQGAARIPAKVRGSQGGGCVLNNKKTKKNAQPDVTNIRFKLVSAAKQDNPETKI